ncbi:olfactory receptor 1D2-like [Dromiciops gliroides]|uniref:olfactory receptor 1D2-like n=1 Tax=Dromiciops gliroides TaxID=33562 RepID=UPI001CC6044C|nr:olfactory receptor 1D2-like [Dromiciops gliroides]
MHRLKKHHPYRFTIFAYLKVLWQQASDEAAGDTLFYTASKLCPELGIATILRAHPLDDLYCSKIPELLHAIPGCLLNLDKDLPPNSALGPPSCRNWLFYCCKRKFLFPWLLCHCECPIILKEEKTVHPGPSMTGSEVAKDMGFQNQTSVSEFLLLGLTQDPKLQRYLFGLFLAMYLITLAGNLLIVLAIISDQVVSFQSLHLHTPMYFFLANLSFTDVCFVSNTVPKMLVNLYTQKKSISYTGCLIQLYFLVSLVALDNLLLAVMAYDRFVAICRPLHYTTIMSPRLYILLLIPCWILSILYGLTHTILMATLTFCGCREITHIFCEMYVLLQLACSDT